MPPSAAETGAPRSAKDDSPLGRYVRILESVAPSRAGLTLTEIAHEAGLQAGTVHRLLRGLLDLGLLRARAGSKSYVPGPRLKNLLHLTMDMAEYSDLAQVTLDRLVEEFGETAHLARLNGDCAESVLMKQPLGSDRAFVQPGRRLPLHAAASGKAILAFQDEAFICPLPLRRPGALHRADQGRRSRDPAGDGRGFAKRAWRCARTSWTPGC